MMLSSSGWSPVGKTDWGPRRDSSPLDSWRGGRCRYVLRAPGGPVDLDRYPRRGGPRFHQVERCVRAGVGEQPGALADDQWVDQQGDFVDKLVGEQPAGQVAAAVHLQLPSPLGFQLADGGRDVSGEQ